MLAWTLEVHVSASDVRDNMLADMAQKAAIYAPQPDYPPDARARNISGSGRFLLRIRVSTGHVVDVSTVRSTGHSILDTAAMQSLHHWRFKPGALPSIKQFNPNRKDAWATQYASIIVPIDFTLSKP